MNTHDKIELPPLPTSFVLGYAQGTIEDIENYARAAVEADRKHKGEPVAWPADILLAAEMAIEDAEDDEDPTLEIHASRIVESLSPPQTAKHNIDYEKLYEQMCNRCDSLDAKLAEYERRGEPVAWLRNERGVYQGKAVLDPLVLLSSPTPGFFTATYSPVYTTPQPADTSGAPTHHTADSGAQDGIQATPPADPVKIDVDTLAQEIRRVDGNNVLGAGAIAEALMPLIQKALQSQDTEDAERLDWLIEHINDIDIDEGHRGWFILERGTSNYITEDNKTAREAIDHARRT